MKAARAPRIDPPRSERFEARMPSELKALLGRAAGLRGQTLTDFVLSTAAAEARRAVRDHETLEFTARDQQIFAEALLNPPPPSAKLLTAADLYRRRKDEVEGSGADA